MKLHIGAGKFPLEGFVNLDLTPLKGIDVAADVHTLPFLDDSFTEIKGSHILEHLADPLKAMGELWRVATNGALLQLRLPHGASDDAWEDPTHVRAYFQQSFGYFSQPFYWRADYGYRGDWQPQVVRLLVPRSWVDHQGQSIIFDIQRQRNIVREMVVDLIAVKPAREPLKSLIVLPKIEVHPV